MSEEIRQEIPVICAECKHVSIRGRNLYCEKKQKAVYEAKPKWCPLPPLYKSDDKPVQLTWDYKTEGGEV